MSKPCYLPAYSKPRPRSCSKLEISVTEHLVEVVDELSTTAVVFFRSTAVVESLSTTSTRCSVTEISSLLQDSTNRMRNLHQDQHVIQIDNNREMFCNHKGRGCENPRGCGQPKMIWHIVPNKLLKTMMMLNIRNM